MRKLIFKNEIFWLFLILLLSWVIRWHNINNLPYGIEGDEASISMAFYFNSHGIKGTERGLWSYFDSMAETFPVFTKTVQLAFILFGADILSPRKILTLTSILALLSFYIFLRQFASKKASLITLILYSFSTYKLIMSRLIVPYYLGEVFIYPAMFFILKISSNRMLVSCLLALLSGLFITLTILSMNLAFIMPIVGFVTLTIIIFKRKIGLKKASCYIFSFFLPFLLFFPLLHKSFLQESPKIPSLKQGIFDIKNPKQLSFYANFFVNNGKIVKEQLFDKLRYETSDMDVSYPSSLIPKLISTAFLIGLILSLFKIGKYFPIIVWLLISDVTSHIVLGLNPPRMWFLTLGIVFIFVGITIDNLLQKIKRLPSKLETIIFIFFITISIYIIHSQIDIFYKYAVNNQSYRISFREMNRLVKKYKEIIFEKLIFVSDEEMRAGTANTIMSFYYLSIHPQNARTLKNLTRQEMGSLTREEFIRDYPLYINRNSTIITDEQSYPHVREVLFLSNNCQYNIYKHKYFYELISYDCF